MSDMLSEKAHDGPSFLSFLGVLLHLFCPCSCRISWTPTGRSSHPLITWLNHGIGERNTMFITGDGELRSARLGLMKYERSDKCTLKCGRKEGLVIVGSSLTTNYVDITVEQCRRGCHVYHKDIHCNTATYIYLIHIQITMYYVHNAVFLFLYG